LLVPPLTEEAAILGSTVLPLGVLRLPPLCRERQHRITVAARMEPCEVHLRSVRRETSYQDHPTAQLRLLDGLRFDGSGQLRGILTQRVNSDSGPITLFKVPYTGNYTVNPDWTVEDTWFNLSNGTSSTHESTIFDNGNGFVIINTTVGPTVVSGEAHRVISEGNDRDR
jgi:hypothetical protein